MEEEITQVQSTPQTGMLGQFRLGAPLGQGLLGVVHDAFNPVADKPCAIKVFRRDLPGGSVTRGRYIHESELVARIDHPSIAQTYGSSVVDNQLYTTMERLDGENLTQLIRQQAPLSRRSFFPLLREICAGLAAAHTYGVAHRRLHAGQVMVSWGAQGPQIKLLDFGTHHLLPPLGDVVPGWVWKPEHGICVAPEQAKGALSDGDSRSDVYALSVMLYEMVTGRVPFLADSFAATLEQHVSDAPTPPSKITNIPTALEEAILRGLEKDPRKRIPSVEAFLAALDPMAVTGQHQLVQTKKTTTGRHVALTTDVSQEIQLPVSNEPPAFQGTPDLPPPVLAPEPKLPRNRWWLFVVLAVVVVGCGITITLLLLSEDEPTRPVKPIKPRTIPKARKTPRKTPRPPKAKTPATKATTVRPVPVPTPPKPKGAVKIATSASAARIRLAGRPVKKVEGIGALEVATPNDKAEVFVNGRFKGKGKLVLLPRLPSGTYRIHLVINGDKTPHRDVQLEPNQRLTVRF